VHSNYPLIKARQGSSQGSNKFVCSLISISHTFARAVHHDCELLAFTPD